MTGQVHGGQQPVSGAKVYLYAASTGGYATPAVSLISGAGYVTSDSSGSFNLTGTYPCPTGAYVYALAVGGNPGLPAGTTNSKIGLMSGLGACSDLLLTPSISINEVTTVATAFALAQFFGSETQLGTSSSNIIGLTNAFTTINNLVSPSSGIALLTTPSGNGLVPQGEINSLANALAACINSDGTGAPCNMLMTAANVTGAAGTPIDTAQAAINIAQQPGANTGVIFGLGIPTGVFQPSLGTAPNDWTVSIEYSQSGIGNNVSGIAVDAGGNIWLSNKGNNTLNKVSPAGVFISGAAGYTSGAIFSITQPAIDLSGNVWVGSQKRTAAPTQPNTIQEFSANGAVISGTGFTNSCLTTPSSLAIDVNSNVWVGGVGFTSAAPLCELNSAGALISPVGGYTGGGLQPFTHQISIDTSGAIWPSGYVYTPTYSWALSKFSATGAALSPSTGYGSAAFNAANGSAIDNAGNIWVAGFNVNTSTGNITGGAIAEFDNSGNLLSPTTGFPATFAQWILVDGASHIWSSYSSSASYSGQLTELGNDGSVLSPSGGFSILNSGSTAALDASGNLWQANNGAAVLTETVGIAAPVVTPVVRALSLNKLGQRP